MEFVAIIMQSSWGWKYLVAILLAGYCGGRNGALWCLAFIMGGLGWLTGMDSPALTCAAQALAAGPVAALQAYFTNPPWDLSPGGGAVLLGLALGAVLLPAANAHVRFAIQTRLVSSYAGEENAGMLASLQVLNQVCGGPFEMVRAVVRLMTVNIAWPAFAVCLWMALSQLGSQEGALVFAWLGLPDITLPRLAPVWEQHYFIAPVVLFILHAVYAGGLEESGGWILRLAPETVTSLRVIAGISLACFLPAGICLFLVGYLLSILPSSWEMESEVVREILDREEALEAD